MAGFADRNDGAAVGLQPLQMLGMEASGIIAVNDQVHKKVTVVAFTYSNEPLILLSTNQSFSYAADP